MRIKLGCAVLLLGCPVYAAEWADLIRQCGDVTKSFGFDSLKSCATDLFTAKPIHITATPTVPGGGTALGLTYTHRFDRGRWQRDFTATAASSFRGYWLVNGAVTLTHGKFGGDWNTARDRFQIQLYTRAKGMPLMPYYGLGPQTTQSGLVDYSARDIRAGASVFVPLQSWLAIGGTAEQIWPHAGAVNSPTVRSIERYYNEATAPGLLRQPSFTRSEIFVNPRYLRGPAEFTYKIAYNFYHDDDTGRYSFGQFRVDALHSFFPERLNGGVKRDSIVYIFGRLDTSVTSKGNAIPFYLQDTLGGADIDNTPTLRAFRDYRFRGPNLLLIQVQAERRMWGPLGLMAFYDTGKVALAKSDINFSNLRHSFGFGVTLWTGSKVVFRAYVGLGGGEGHHTFFGIPDLSGSSNHL